MFKRILNDVILWLVAIAICMLWRVAATKDVVWPYLYLFLSMMVVWVLFGLVFMKYRHSYKVNWLWQEIVSMVMTGLAVMLVAHLSWPYLPRPFSHTFIYWMLGIVMVLDAIMILLKHYYKFALNMTVPLMKIEQRHNARCTRIPTHRSPASMQSIHDAVLSLTTEEDFDMLLDKASLDSNLTKVIADRERFSLLQLPQYQYNTIVDITILNNIKGINKRFCVVNQKLPDNGIYVVCYRPQEYVKKKILTSYPVVINYLVYAAWFIYRRVLPRLMLTSRLHYDITGGHKRTLSKAEVLGRLYYCGFVVDDVVPMGHIEYVFAHRNSQPYPQQQLKVYGPLIKLPRVCEHKEIKYFYKFRTMHPYSEYIQQYVFDQRGGMNIADKAEDDFRITHWGRILRKYWLDELPMLLNWFKRDCKLVGIRPLSQPMFDTYPPELQEKRIKTKPGLIPPFYVDHPQTFDELYASENKYLDEYFRHPVRTDFKYFFATLHSILFKRMHSA